MSIKSTNLIAAAALIAALNPSACGHGPAPDVAVTPAPVTEEAPLLDKVTVTLEDEPPVVREDLEQIRAAGVLRVLVHRPQQTSLERTGSPVDRELAQVGIFARSEALAVRFVNVTQRSQLETALIEGRGDVIAAQFSKTEDRQTRLLFSDPVRFVQELLIAPKKARSAPGSVQMLAGREVSVRLSSSFKTTLEGLEVDPPVKVLPLEEHLDPHSILSRVGKGQIGLTVADSDAYESYSAYGDDVQIAAVVKDKVPIAWALRPGATELQAAINTFIAANVEVHNDSKAHTGDLDELRRRGILRVAIPNNANAYFFYRGMAMGYQYGVARRIADHLGLRLEVVVARRQKDLIPLVLEGRADLVAAVLTETPQRLEVVDFSLPLTEINEVLVQPSSEPTIESVSKLARREIHVRRSSSYWQTLMTLKASVANLDVVPADEEFETEDLIALVGEGEIPLTVADFDIFAMAYSPDSNIQGGLVLGSGRKRGYAMRKNSPKLKSALDQAVKVERERKSSNDPNPLTRRPKVAPRQALEIPKGGLSPYDGLAKKAGEAMGVDWKLIVAQMKVESGFDPLFENWVGAQGLLQVMPHTLKILGLEELDLKKPEEGIHAGVKTYKDLYNRFENSLSDRNRRRFALAAYHIGFDHVEDARALARRMELDPDKWSGNVEKAMVLLEDPTYAGSARYGYCRGREASRYVAAIEKLYTTSLRRK